MRKPGAQYELPKGSNGREDGVGCGGGVEVGRQTDLVCGMET